MEEEVNAGLGCGTYIGLFVAIFILILGVLGTMVFFAGDATEADMYIQKHLKSPDSFAKDHAKSGSIYEQDNFEVFTVVYEATNSFGGSVRSCEIVLLKEGTAVDKQRCSKIDAPIKLDVAMLLARNGKKVTADEL